jgi:hypothetical protein
MLTQTTGTSHDSAHPKPKRILKLYASIFFTILKPQILQNYFQEKKNIHHTLKALSSLWLDQFT